MPNTNGLEYDQLTGLYSRWHHQIELQEILDSRQNRVYGLIDVDNFKQINLKYGSVAGDNLLKEIAVALQDVYPDASLCRVSADEFAFILAPTTYARYNMCEMTRVLFDRLHLLQVEGSKHEYLSFSVGSVYIDPNIHSTPDSIYVEALGHRREAKKHEGNYLHSKYGSIPDVGGAFRILCADRKLFDSLNDRLYAIHNETDWLSYLNESAAIKSDIYLRNQGQLQDIMTYYSPGDLPECEYELLFSIVMGNAETIDAFLLESLIQGILLPYYERCDHDLPAVRSRLGHLYLLLAHSLIAEYRMGHNEAGTRIKELLLKCLDTCRDLPHDSIQFEPYFFALCEIVGHYENLAMLFFTIEECDAYYEELRQLLTGPDPIVFRNDEVVAYFKYLLDNARLFPIYRACFLRLLSSIENPRNQQELAQRLDYIRQHQVDGMYDLAGDDPEFQLMVTYLQDLLLHNHSIDNVLNRLIMGLEHIYKSDYGKLSKSNIVIVSYLFLGAAQTLMGSNYPADSKRQLAIRGVNFLLELLRKRESVATDHQQLFMIQVLMRAMVVTPMLTAADKLYYLKHAMAATMLSTYCHSQAVAAYAKVILENIIDHNPQLLVGEGRPYRTNEELRLNREPLLEFMECACLLHDIGKMKITSIIGNSYRRLYDIEFDLIRHHPKFGIDILKNEPAFAPFHPFVYQHHRWWDGSQGYPDISPNEPQNNTRILVDILSLCDSLEAATCHIGRTYRKVKPFHTILDEFYCEAGTRYSSEVLQSIIGHPESYRALRQMVDVHWQDIYRNIFTQMVSPEQAEKGPSLSSSLPDLYRNTRHLDTSHHQLSLHENMPMPDWMHHQAFDSQRLHFVSLHKRNRMAVEHAGMVVFYYDVAADRMNLTTLTDGKVQDRIIEHFSSVTTSSILPPDCIEQVMTTLHNVIAQPHFPKEGQKKFETQDKTRTMLITYTTIIGYDGRVLSVVGHLEDSGTSRSRMLQTIGRQNHYLEMFGILVQSYMTIVHTDVALQRFELIRGYPALEANIHNFTTTQQLIDYTCNNLVDAEFQEDFMLFCDPATIDQRMQGNSHVTFEYHSRTSGWLLAHLLPVKYDAEGRISHLLFCTENIDSEHRQLTVLSYAAHHDALTGLYNRLKGEELVSQKMAKGGTQIFAILDCDGFKRINDEISHLVGDKVLQELGKAMDEYFGNNLVLRLGGDEFVVYISGDAACALVNKMNGVRHYFEAFAERISSIRIPELDNVAPTVSCGIVVTDGSMDNLTFNDLYRPADTALHQSKQFRHGTITISELRHVLWARESGPLF